MHAFAMPSSDWWLSVHRRIVDCSFNSFKRLSYNLKRRNAGLAVFSGWYIGHQHVF